MHPSVGFAKETTLLICALDALVYVCVYLVSSIMPLTGDTFRKPQSSPVSTDALYVGFGMLASFSSPLPLVLSHCPDIYLHVSSSRLLPGVPFGRRWAVTCQGFLTLTPMLLAECRWHAPRNHTLSAVSLCCASSLFMLSR